MPEHPGEPAPRGDELALEIRGALFTGWEVVEVTRSLEAVSGSFRLTVNPTARQPWPVRVQDEVKVRMGEDVLMTGWVDSFDGDSSRAGRSITVSGRDRTGDLVDCSPTNEPGQWIGRTLEQIAQAIAEPFGVGVRNERTPTEAFPLFTIQPGETAWTAIERAARLRATLAYSDGDGSIVLAEPAIRSAEADLIEGGQAANVLRSRVTYSAQNRYSLIRVLGQQTGNDQGWGAAPAHVEGEATDSEITRYRPIVILAEGQTNVEVARARAQWEAITRAARGANLELEVAGWRELPGGPPWSVNSLAYVVLPSWQIRGSMLIRGVSFQRSKSAGQTTTLSLVRKDAYRAQPDVDVEAQPFATLLEGEDLEE